MKSFLPFKESCGTLLCIALLMGPGLLSAQSVPDRIQNLNVINVGINSVYVTWTAPVGEGGGRVAAYRLRVSTVPITEQNFDSSTNVSIVRAPLAPGTTEYQSVYGLTAGTKYYFAIKSANFMGSYSAISNVPEATTSMPPRIHVEPVSLEDSLVMGESSSRFITIRNDGAGPLQLTFSHGIAWPTIIKDFVVIPPYDSLTAEVTLYAGGLVAGTHTENFSIYSNDPLNGTVYIPVTLHVTDNGFPIAVITGSTSDDFGEVYVGSNSVPGWTYVKNMGSEPLIISDVSTTNPNIHIGYPESPPQDTLQTSESYYLLYQYRPVTAGPSFGNITVETNDPVNPVLNVGVAGTGVISPVQLVLDKEIVTYTLYSGEMASEQLTISNEGYENLEFFINDYGLPDYADVTPRFGVVPPGESVTLEISFNTTGLDAGQYSFEITLENNDPRNYGALFFPVTLLVKAPEVVSLAMTNSKTGATVSSGTDQFTFDVADPVMAHYTIQANTVPSKAGSVSFSLDGVFSNTDNIRAYTINNWLLPTLTSGNHIITAKAFERSNGQGKGGIPKEATIKVINSAEVTDFDLVNMSGVKLLDIENGSVIDISQIGSSSVNIIGNTSVSTVKSVKFKVNGTTSRIDNQAPYAVKGTSSGDTFWPIKVGNYTVTAYPYIQYYGWGVEGKSKTISFQVVNGGVPTVANARSASSPNEEVSQVAGIDEEKEPWSVYPVPVKDELTIELASSLDGMIAIRIVNLQGQVMHANTSYGNNFSKYVVSTERIGLRGGFYVVQFQHGNGKLLTKKFLKE